MNPGLLDLLQCPYDGRFPLEWAGDHLGCSHCHRRYPIREGIACLMPDPLRQDSLAPQPSGGATAQAQEAYEPAWHDKQQEICARDEQAPQYDGFVGEYLERLQRHHVAASITRPTGRLLDVGAGTGRLTMALQDRAREVVAVDFSYESLRVLVRAARDVGATAIHAVQADASLLPFRDKVFDAVTSAHTMHHLPRASRSDALGHIRRVLRPGGVVVLTVYHYDLYRRLRIRLGWRYPDIEKEGYHGGRIYYYAFTRQELWRELDGLFHVERMRGIVNVPRELFSRLARPGWWGGVWMQAAGALDRGISRTPAASRLGLLLLAVGRRR